jgi:taurine dioxygenase
MDLVRVTPFGGFDNHARAYDYIEARPLAAAMGAEIVGADLAQLSDAAFDELLDALYHHKMVFMRSQKISHAVHQSFTARLGEFGTDAYTTGVEGYANVQPVIKEADTRKGSLFGGSWHTDSAFLERPPSISTLRSVEIPPYGGDTVWANTVLAYSMLSQTMQQMLAPLKIRMSAQKNNATVMALNGTNNFASASKGEEAIAGHLHPLVRTHPVSGEKALYVDEAYAVIIGGMTPQESAPILEFLVWHITQQAFTCRLRWEPDMFVMWDNRICIHSAFNDYDGYRREMYRTTVMGEKPI